MGVFGFQENTRKRTCQSIIKPIVEDKNVIPSEGYTVYYSNRCPYAEYHVNESLEETAPKRSLKINRVKFETLEEEQNAPTPATIFSLY